MENFHQCTHTKTVRQQFYLYVVIKRGKTGVVEGNFLKGALYFEKPSFFKRYFLNKKTLSLRAV